MNAKFPFRTRDSKIATINNRVLCFGNSYFLGKRLSKCINAGGYSTSRRKQIIEFNFTTESWTVIGEMKEARVHHAVSVVLFDDYEKWCI